ncbi:MAG: TetR/AcrR family transcriptional regulator [Myxococcales bacterium]|nr:TetR/AcrR family transcriptional regulator [Myxococcales bacterium]
MTKRGDKGRESPRTQRVREIVLAEGVRLLGSHGGAAVTALRISERTGVARSTIYRHWPDQPALLLDVVERIVRPDGTIEITGELQRDLRSALTSLRARMNRRPFRVVFAALLTQANSDDAFAQAQQRLVQGVLAPTREVLEGAVAQQRLPADLDVASACLRLAGPLLAQHVMVRAPITDALVEDLIRQFVDLHPEA